MNKIQETNEARCDRSDHWSNVIIFGECWGGCGLVSKNDSWLKRLNDKFKAEPSDEPLDDLERTQEPQDE